MIYHDDDSESGTMHDAPHTLKRWLEIRGDPRHGSSLASTLTGKILPPPLAYHSAL